MVKMFRPYLNRAPNSKMKRLYDLINAEEKRQIDYVNLIASENYPSQHILDILATKLSNKYAEGYGLQRYYAGCQYVGEIEQLAIENAQKLFNAQNYSVNVQALSGAPANLGVYNAFLKPGDSILSLALQDGGHLSHGATGTMVNKFYKIRRYNIDPETERINVQEINDIIKKHHKTSTPVKMLIAGYSAYTRDINYKELREICDKYGVHLHVDCSHTAGLIATKLLNSPVDIADTIMTTTHKTLRGPRGALIFSRDGKKLDRAIFPGLQGGPHMNNIAGICAMLIEAQTPEYVQYQSDVLANRAIIEQQFNKKNLFSGGSDNHMLIIKNIKDGKLLEDKLQEQGIIVNRQVLQYKTHGIRLGTPFITSQGYTREQAKQIGQHILTVIQEVEGEEWNE